MCNCKNCYWYGQCPDAQEDLEECGHYEFYDIDQSIEIEYEAELQMRADIYNEFVREMQR